MTNITELAQSLKAAAEKYKSVWGIARYSKAVEAREKFHELVTPANVIALVEALEKAQQERENWRTSFDNERFRADKLKAYIDDMEPIRAAAEKLVRCKGRYHSEQNYRALAALFGVKTPDLPPLEHENVHYADAAEMEIEALRKRIAELESRTVKLPRLKMLEDYLAEVAIEERRQILVGVKLEFHRALTAAGIKVEAE
ncbi:TPA: ead/Ea22-like family protein [Klebsiella pneumoniae]|uniref:ead/Ea22-like family protein n=1 Tax=Klebsiella pneumoniae TaxID=573 RepID=UPI00254D6C4D|nr:ead/Ea22-like family protein [Klebsiella pneumoniae]MEC5757056.1 ead/Ea22-like family protein [Klebsiella pneumoniae]HBR5855390.1 ead/Ea22-like family protein [Klebsiella pneumoniae]